MNVWVFETNNDFTSGVLMISWRCKLHVGTSQVQMRTKYGNTVGIVLTKCRTYQYLSNLIVNMLNFIIIWTIWRWCYITHDEEGWGWIWSLFITTKKKKINESERQAQKLPPIYCKEIDPQSTKFISLT